MISAAERGTHVRGAVARAGPAPSASARSVLHDDGPGARALPRLQERSGLLPGTRRGAERHVHSGLSVRLPGVRAHRSDAAGRPPARGRRAHKRLLRAPLPPGDGRRDDHGIQGAAAYHSSAE